MGLDRKNNNYIIRQTWLIPETLKCQWKVAVEWTINGWISTYEERMTEKSCWLSESSKIMNSLLNTKLGQYRNGTYQETKLAFQTVLVFTYRHTESVRNSSSDRTLSRPSTLAGRWPWGTLISRRDAAKGVSCRGRKQGPPQRRGWPSGVFTKIINSYQSYSLKKNLNSNASPTKIKTVIHICKKTVTAIASTKKIKLIVALKIIKLNKSANKLSKIGY